MRPYLAIVKDSFREALASRTLWILLILIAITLVALAPFAYREVLTAGLQRRDLTDPADFVEELRTAARDNEPSPGRHIWSLLDKPLRDKLRTLREPKGDAPATQHMAFQQTVGELRESLDRLMRQEAFYSAEAWRDVDLRAEARRLAVADPAELSEEQIGRRNRLALEAAFPEMVRISRPVSTQFTYLGMDAGWPIPLEADDLQERLMPFILFVLDWVVGPVGVFVAVLVTASIIPQMFDAGSLNLLLSKPISRTLLFLFKVLGGCAFVLIAATLLFTGLWLILGLRLDMWSHKLLLYIPVYLFLFIVYYVVSAFSGLVWRSTIVAIAVSVTFWAVCYGVGMAEWSLKTFLFEPQRITYIAAANDTLLTIDETRVPHVWDAESRTWEEVFLTEDQQRIRNRVPFPVPMPEFAGRVYDPDKDMLLAIQRDFAGARALWAGREEDGWRRLGGGAAPSDVIDMFREPDGGVIAVSRSGVRRLTGDPAAEPKDDALFGLGKLLPQTPLFSDVSRDLPAFPEPVAAGFDENSGTVAVYSRGRVYTLTRDDDDRYQIQQQTRLESDEDEPAVIGYGGATILVALKESGVVELDAATLQPRQLHQPEPTSPPRFAYSSPDGRYLAVVFHNGKLWLYDNQAQTLEKPRVAGQGDISAAAFPAENVILVADRSMRVSRYRLDSQNLEQRYAPEMDLLETVYRYVVLPIYTVFPKPSELYKTSQYLITGQETRSLDDDDDDLSEPQVKLHPWRPVWSSLAFVIATLVLACVYFERQEF